jgi:uncharacterized membrane protein
VFRYQDWRPEFQKKRLNLKYEKSKFKDKDVSLDDIKETLKRAEKYLLPYRGKIIRMDKINLINILIGLVVCLVLSMVIGLRVHWAYSVIFIFVFFIFAFIQNKIIKRG